MKRVAKYGIPDDWTQEAGYLTCLFCIPNSAKWRALIVGMISSLQNGRTWNETTGSVISAQSAGKEVFESMAMCDLETQLERIADSLEAIEEKAIERYTYEEFIEDLETAFGIGSIASLIVGGIVGLMPNLKLKADFTQIAQGFIETWMRWRPLHAILTTQSASLGVIAASQATSKILGIVSTLLQAVDIIGNGWKDLIFGDKNIWDDILKPIWALFVSDDDGGTGGDNPDQDTTNRIALQLNQQIIIQNTINALCCNAVSDMQEALGTGYIVTGDSSEIVPGGSVPTSPDGITWTTQPGTFDEKCQAAHFIVDWLIAFYGRTEWSYLGTGIGAPSLTTIIQAVLGSVPPIGVTLAGLSTYIGQVLVYLASGNLGIFATMHSKLSETRSEAICALYEAETTEGAITGIVAVLVAAGVNPLDTWAVEVFLRQNNVMGLLWFDNDLVDYSGEDDDCSGCDVTLPRVQLIGILGGEPAQASGEGATGDFLTIPGTYTITQNDVSSNNFYYLAFTLVGDCRHIRIKITNMSGGTGAGGGIMNCNNQYVIIYSNAQFYGNFHEGYKVDSLARSQAFTCTLELQEIS